MKRLRKRMLSILLVLAMAFSLMPVTVFAAAEPPDENSLSDWVQEKISELKEDGYNQSENIYNIQGSDLYRYTFTKYKDSGEGLTLDSVFIILPGKDATDNIPDYESSQDGQPWADAKPSAVYIADGVTGIGAHAFDTVTTLTTLEIENPQTLTYVGKYAFNGCDKLTGFTSEAPLDLSGVTKLGEYAFNSCERLQYVKLGNGLAEIPQYAFNYAGLRDIEIPASVTSIGDYAFANNNFSEAGELVLPEGLETIGNYAFYRNLATGAASGFTSITIPSAVTTIGDYAFYNHRRLETVTVDATAVGGFKQPGHAAFGTAPTDGSYSETVDITVDDITYENVSTGTQFLTEDEDTADLFVSGENCFLGDLEPLKFDCTQPATCTEDGYDRYTLTIKNVTTDGEPVTMNVDFPIEKLGHDYERQEDTRPATCEKPKYIVELCINEDNKKVPKGSCVAPERLTAVENSTPLGHDYDVSSAENQSISSESDGDAVITYTCTHEKAGLHDGEHPASFSWKISKTTLTAGTDFTLNDLASSLPTPTGVDHSISAKLEWAEENPSALLTEGSHNYKVKLVVTGTSTDVFPAYADAEFTIRVQVNKVKLDFSKMAFQNTTRFIGLTNEDFSYSGNPEGTTYVKTEYSTDEGKSWSENAPSEAVGASGGKYLVRVIFSYPGAQYLLDTTDNSLLPTEGYTLAAGEDANTATVTGPYIVQNLTAEYLSVTPVQNLVYNKADQDTIRVEGVPEDAKVTATWMEGNQEQTDTETATSTTVTIAGITNAGTYPVTIKVEHQSFADGSVTFEAVNGTIAKKVVTTPVANANLQEYTPGLTQTGVPDSKDSDVYTVEGNTATDAGEHTATAKLEDSANYKWSTGDQNETGTVTITYTIPKRRVTEPKIYTTTYTYDKTAKTPLSGINDALALGYNEETGTLTATYENEIVFTATNAKKTDAAKYEVTVSLNNTDTQKNYVWSTGGDADLTLNWEITPKQIAAPAVTVSNATYTAQPYAATNITCAQHELLSLGDNHTYYTSSGLGDTPLNYVPTNAGSYKVEINFAFPEGEKPSNYDITGTTRYSFEITKASLTVTNPTNLTYTYTGAPQAIDGVTVSGVLDGEQSDTPYTLTYTSQTWDEFLNDGEGGWSTSTTNHPGGVQLEDVGKYLITPVIESKNYTAEITPYEVTITEATQTIRLTPDDASKDDWSAENNTMTKTLGDAAFSVTGQGYVGENATSAQITYESSDPDTASVDANTGKVTLHKATAEGASVTITVKAEEDDSGNYGDATATYTLTVNKATPTIDVSEYTNNKFETPYTGSAITDYEKAELTGAGNGAVEPDGDLVYTFYTNQSCGEDDKVNNGQTGEGVNNNIPITVGTYYLKITYGGDSNYNPAEEKVITVNVTEAEVGDVTVEDYEAVYNGEDNSLSGSVSAVVGFKEDEYTVKYAQSATQPAADADVWKDDITVKNVSDSTGAKDPGNHYWYMVTITDGNYAPKIGEIQVTITPAELTVGGVLTSFTKAYDSTDTVTEELNGITVTGVGEDEIVVSNPTGKYETEDAGSKLDVTITLTLGGDDITWGNYKYNDTALTEGKLTVTKTAAGEITQKEITVTGISATDRVYDGTETVALTGTPMTTGQIDGDNLTLTLAQNATGTVQNSSQNANDAANVGNGKKVDVSSNVITLSGDDASNYKVVGVGTDAGGDITVNITKRPVTLEFVGIDGEQRVITKPYTGQPVNVTVTAIENQGGNAGFVGNDNLKAEDVAYTYTPVSPTTDAEHTAVGDYTVTAALQEDSTQGNYSNYELNFPEAAALRITNTTGVAVDAKDYTDKYTGKPHDVTGQWKFTGYVEGTEKTVSFIKKDDTHTTAPEASSSEWQTITFKDVSQSGEYWWKVTADSHEAVVGTDTVKITITPLDLEINTSLSGNGTKEYDGDATVDETITGTVSGTVNDETITATAETASYDKADAGDRTITISYTLSGADLSNYTYGGNAIPDNGQIEVTEKGKITPKEITVTIRNKTKTYDGQAPTVTSDKDDDWTVAEGAIVNDDGLGVTLTVEESGAAVGTYHITGKADNGNYKVTFAGEDSQNNYGVYTVTARPISVKIGNASGIYGDAPVLTTGSSGVTLTDVTTEVENAGLVEDEDIYSVLTDLELTTDATNTSGVGNGYTISATGGTGEKSDIYGNYQVTFTNGTYTVEQRPVTIAIEDKSSAYGCELERLTSSDAYTGDANKDGIVNEDNLGIQLTTTASASANVGSYPITGTATGEKAKNYAVTFAGGWSAEDDNKGAAGTYYIKKADLTLAFTNQTEYAGVNEEVNNILTATNASSNSLLSAEQIKALRENGKLTYMAEPADAVQIDQGTGVVTVKQANTSVTITAQVKDADNYNDATETFTISAHQAGSMGIIVAPQKMDPYTGSLQTLVHVTNPLSAKITYKVTDGNGTEIETTDGNGLPAAVDAGTYYVTWTAKAVDGNYSDESSQTPVVVIIPKADVKGNFAAPNFIFVTATDTSPYDSAEKNPLTVTSPNYTGKATDYDYSCADEAVAGTINNGSKVHIFGQPGDTTTVSVTVPGDANYNQTTLTYTLAISEQLAELTYTANDVEVPYDGQPHSVKVQVNSPASGAQVRYADADGNYTLAEAPAYTDVKRAGNDPSGAIEAYEIGYKITAAGYQEKTGTVKLTIQPKNISAEMFEDSIGYYTYTGGQITPHPVVLDGNVKLTENTDYTVAWGENKEQGENKGTVTVSGVGNYSGNATVYFNINPVGSGMTASLDKSYGTYDPVTAATAKVTVTHHTSPEHAVALTAENASYTFSATDLEGNTIEDGAAGSGDTLTFTKVGVYDITLKLTGDHAGTFHLTYVLLPLSGSDGGLTMTVGDEPQKVYTYGDANIDGNITVKAGEIDVTEQCDLTYVYTAFDGTTSTSAPYTSNVLVNAGVYTVTAVPKADSSFTGTGTFVFFIQQRNLSEATLEVEDGGLVYNQQEQKPNVTAAVTGAPEKDKDYTVSYYNNVNASQEAQVIVIAKGNNFTGSKTAEFTIQPKPIEECAIADIPNQYYTGNPVVPDLTITDGEYTLVLNHDYTVTCTDQGPGQATVTITGIGNYTNQTEKTFTIIAESEPQPTDQFTLTVEPDAEWTYGSAPEDLEIQVKFGDTGLTLGEDYTLTVNGVTYDGTEDMSLNDAVASLKALKPGQYKVTAQGIGDAFSKSSDTAGIQVFKVKPTVTVTATPGTLSGSGEVTLTLTGSNLPAGTDLTRLLTATRNGTTLDLSSLNWTQQGNVWTAKLALPNADATYIFTLAFAETDTHAAASDTATVVTAKHTNSGGTVDPDPEPEPEPEPDPAPTDPDDTGVSDWLDTDNHKVYLNGYPDDSFQPEKDMTRAEAAQMFYNLLRDQDVETTVSFTDVAADAWYATAVNALASLEIVNGVGDDRFSPERTITRAEFTTMAMRFCDGIPDGENIFSDVDQEDWFYEYVVGSIQYGWINGYPDGTFRPNDTISRAEVTTITNRMLGRAADEAFVDQRQDSLRIFTDLKDTHWAYYQIVEATNAHEYTKDNGTEDWTKLV